MHLNLALTGRAEQVLTTPQSPCSNMAEAVRPAELTRSSWASLMPGSPAHPRLSHQLLNPILAGTLKSP